MRVIKLLLITTLLSITRYANAYDFKVGNICYNIISATDCEIVECENIRTITIPATVWYNNYELNVTKVGAGAFYDCFMLESVTIPESITSIGDYAFYGCMSLPTIKLPESVESIGEGAFSYCCSLTSLYIPEGVEFIGKEAFAYCCMMTSISIPNSVVGIGEGAFDDCTSLVSIALPNSVRGIGKMAFPWCRSLKSIIIPNGVSTIGDAAFFSCNALEDIYIPESTVRIGLSAFTDCQNVKMIVTKAIVPPILGEEQCTVFSENLYANTDVYVPTVSLEAYRHAKEWKEFKNLKGGAEDMTGIDDITIDNDANGDMRMYDIQGNRLRKLEKGINIISYPDGSARKKIMK